MVSLVLEDESLLLCLLQTLQPVVNEATAPVAKKARLDGLDPFCGKAVIWLAYDLVQAAQRTVIHCSQTPTVDSTH